MPQHTLAFMALPRETAAQMVKLAGCPAARRLTFGSTSASAEELLDDARLYLEQARLSGLPPERWMLVTRLDHQYHSLASPLLAFAEKCHARAELAPAAALLAAAGCPFWGERLEVYRITYAAPQTPPHHRLAEFIFSAGAPNPMRSLYLRLALADPLSPKALMGQIRAAYALAVSGSSPAAPGVLGPADEYALGVCSLLVESEAELALAAHRPGWGGAKLMLADAKKRLAVKLRPAAVDAKALQDSLSDEQKRRLRALSVLLTQFPDDPALIHAALNATDWLLKSPQLAAISFDGEPTLLSDALMAGCGSAFELLADAGANPWLVAAQEGYRDACSWAVHRLAYSPPGADLSSLARALLEGSLLSGLPCPKKRCLGLVSDAAADLRKRRLGGLNVAESEGEVERLKAALERHAIDASLPSRPARAQARRLPL